MTSVANKADYVRSEARKPTGGHHCHWPDCDRPVPPAMWGCKQHWFDEASFAEVAHHTHACQGCGFVWRPAKVNTHGVRFLPGYSNDQPFPEPPQPYYGEDSNRG